MSRARRALLYMPGDDLHKIEKAATLGVDCVCMDMEDGVAMNRKEQARLTIVEALGRLDFGRAERLVRINAIGSGLEQADLEQVLPAHPDGIVIPKVENAAQIRQVSGVITAHEARSGWEMGGMPIIVIVESAMGIVHLEEIATADQRLQAIIFGAEDLAVDVGATRTKAGWEVFYARSAVVTVSAAFGLQAIDMVYIDFKDRQDLYEEALEGARLGFSGKQIIHPNQVEPVQQAFTPGDEAIAYARRVMQAYEENRRAGRGAFALDGKMIDAPIVKSAERVIALAQAAGIITSDRPDR